VRLEKKERLVQGDPLGLGDCVRHQAKTQMLIMPIESRGRVGPAPA
jgi:hypothetical protein